MQIFNFYIDEALLLNIFTTCIPFLEVIISVMLGGMLGYFAVKKGVSGYKDAKSNVAEMIKQDSERRGTYEAINDYLTVNGIKYRLGDSFTPFEYIVLRVLSVVIGFLVGLILYSLIGALVGAVACFFLPKIIINEIGDNDNDEMLDDIQQMYGIIAIQLKNKVFFSKSLYDCYLSTKNPRLKKALRELSLDIEGFSSIEDSTEKFRRKFKNEYIDNFCRVIEQSQDTGQSVEMLNNVESQIDAIVAAINIRDEHKEKTRAFIVEVIAFLGAAIFVIYLVYMSMSVYSLNGLW